MQQIVPLPPLAGAVLLALLGGCNSNPVAPSDPTFPTAGRSLAAGETLTASAAMTSGLVTDRATGRTERHETDFSLKKNAYAAPRVTAGGQTMDFTPQDLDILDVAWVKVGDPSQRVLVNTELTGDALTEEGRGFAQVWSYFHEDPDTRFRGNAVIGNATPPASLPASASATFIGGAGLHIMSKTDPDDAFSVEWGTVGTAISDRDAEARLTANFVDRTVSGKFTGALRSDGLDYRVAPEHDMVLERAQIVGNGFRGALAGMNIDAGSTYEGKFFGPSAEEAAGVMNVEYGGGTHLGRGWFHVDRQVD